MNTFQQRLITAMENAGMTQAELSKATGISQGTLTHYTHGHYIPKQKRVHILANALNVSPSWLFGVDGEKAPAPEDGLVALYRSLSPDQQKEAIKYLRYLSQLEND